MDKTLDTCCRKKRVSDSDWNGSFLEAGVVVVDLLWSFKKSKQDMSSCVLLVLLVMTASIAHPITVTATTNAKQSEKSELPAQLEFMRLAFL